MLALPKLKVKVDAWGKSSEEIQNFEKAKDFPFGGDWMIVAEGQQINSYDDLLKLVSQECYKDKRYLEVAFFPLIMGG